jgi:hypothetical protein
MSERDTEKPGIGTPSDDEIRRVVEDFEHHTLDKIKGVAARLIYLASLRDHNTGSYHHYGLESRYSEAAVDQGLHRCHTAVFTSFVALPLREQTQDLLRFFESLKAERSRLVEVWQHLRAYRLLAPEDASPLAQQLFRQNIETILQVLKESELWELLDEPHGDPDHLT